MLTITIQVNAPAFGSLGVKEAIAMALEQFGDVKVISIREESPRMEQMRMGEY